MKESNQSNTNEPGRFKIMNKLGTSFYLLFLVGLFIPISRQWSGKMSMFESNEPILLVILALLGIAVYLSGISGLFARVIAFSFIVCVVLTLYLSAYNIYEETKVFSSSNFGPRHVKEALAPLAMMTKQDLGSKIQYTLSPGGIVLIFSFFGILCCIFSPRYKVNKKLQENLKASLADTSQETETDNADNTSNTESVKKKSTEKMLITALKRKAVSAIKNIYQIAGPIVNTLLDKCATVICDNVPPIKEKKEKVKLGLACVFITLILFIVF